MVVTLCALNVLKIRPIAILVSHQGITNLSYFLQIQLV